MSVVSIKFWRALASTLLIIVCIGVAAWSIRLPKIETDTTFISNKSLQQNDQFVSRDGLNMFGVKQQRPTLVQKELPKVVAITFDDGPHKRNTPLLLDILDRHNAKATFFILGLNASTQSGIVLDIHNRGHQIGNHTWDHTVNPATFAETIERTDATLQAITGKMPTIIRTPYGFVSEEIQKLLTRPIVLWSIDSRDWQLRDADSIANRALEKIKPGDVLIMHDIYAQSVVATDLILRQLAANGYSFVTVDELFDFSAHQGIAVPGEVYYFKDLTTSIVEQ